MTLLRVREVAAWWVGLHLNVSELQGGGWGLLGKEDADSNGAGDGEGDGGEEAEHILDAGERGVHGGVQVIVTGVGARAGE